MGFGGGGGINGNISDILEFTSDFVIEPVVEGITEELYVKSTFLQASYYSVYAGSTAMTAVIPITEPTRSAFGAFEGSNIQVYFYNAQRVQMVVAKLNVLQIGKKKYGRFNQMWFCDDFVKSLIKDMIF